MGKILAPVCLMFVLSLGVFAQYATPVSLHLATSGKVSEAKGTRDVYVQVESQGGENAFTFTFEWDPTRFANPQAVLADGLPPGYVLTVNPYYTHLGRLGVLADGWDPLPVGRVNLVRVTLDVLPNDGQARFKFSTNVLLCSTSDTQGNLVPTEYYDVWANVGTYSRLPASRQQTEIPLLPY